MEWVQQVPYPLTDSARGKLVYAGRLLIFKQVPAIGKLCAFTDSLIKEVFSSSDPGKAQFQLSRNQYLTAASVLQKRFKQHAEPKKLFAAALNEVGIDLQETYWDRMLLRVLPHGDTHTGGPASKIGCHRDTWGSNLYQQLNWWTPIYALTHERTIAFYPHYWSQPLKNTSGSWSFDQYMEHRRATDRRLAATYPSAPQPSETVDASSELRVVIDPGDLLCFSGAHLHASVPNTSGSARFSVEVRTVNTDDIKDKRGAPNIDCDATTVMTMWFRRISDNYSLADALAH